MRSFKQRISALSALSPKAIPHQQQAGTTRRKTSGCWCCKVLEPSCLQRIINEWPCNRAIFFISRHTQSIRLSGQTRRSLRSGWQCIILLKISRHLSKVVDLAEVIGVYKSYNKERILWVHRRSSSGEWCLEQLVLDFSSMEKNKVLLFRLVQGYSCAFFRTLSQIYISCFLWGLLWWLYRIFLRAKQVVEPRQQMLPFFYTSRVPCSE